MGISITPAKKYPPGSSGVSEERPLNALPVFLDTLEGIMLILEKKEKKISQNDNG